MTASLVPLPGEEGRASLEARLEAAVRAEFRVAAYRPDAADPVLGGECAVTGCDGLPRARGLCNAHHVRWRHAGHPEMGEFLAAAPPRRRHSPRMDCFDLSGLSGPLRLEFAYALQCRHDQRGARLSPSVFARVARLAADSGVSSLLALPVSDWLERLSGSDHTARAPRAFLRYAWRRVEELAAGSDPDDVYASDVWDAARLGVAVRVGARVRLRFDGIDPAWLREATKRWVRFRLATGKTFVTARADVAALSSFATFLATRRVAPARPAALTRVLLDDYLSWLASAQLSVPARRASLGGLRTFLDHCRRHDWLPGLPATATLYREDYPRLDEPLPRFIPEFVMAQLEAPESLEQLADPTMRRLAIVLMESGLRITDACCLPLDPLIDDSVGWPCLRFHNAKMAAEQLIPLSATAAEAIRAQQQHVRSRWSAGSPWLFPRSRANPDAADPVAASTVRSRLAAWQAIIGLRDEAGQPVRITPHQFRHTVGARMINQGVPQHIIQRLLGHKSPRMTARYATIHDATVRDAFDDYQRRRVDIAGERLGFDPNAPTADAEWVKHNLARVAASLPNGYCGRPPQQDCPHPNACLTCPDFQTTPAFLPIHRRQRDGTLELIDAAEAAGNSRLAANHRQVHTTLDRVIGALEAIDAEEPTDAAG